jgi:hypothetical protein
MKPKQKSKKKIVRNKISSWDIFVFKKEIKHIVTNFRLYFFF